MARPVDPQTHENRRLHIIGAAMECFARSGFAGTTTAAICKQAQIGSGTFFHYFPTKLDVLLAILELGVRETNEWFASRPPEQDPLSVVLDWLDAQCRDGLAPELAGFVMAVAGVMTDPKVAAALHDDDQSSLDGLEPWLRQGQAQAQIRTDVTAERLAHWMLLFLNGYIDRVTSDRAFAEEAELTLMRRTAEEFLSPRP